MVELLRSRGQRRLAFAAMALLWLAMVGAGMKVIFDYAFAAGAAAAAPARWPSGTALVRDTTRPTLLLVAHPRCPCTRASIGELAELMSHYGERVSARVLFVKPAGSSADWERSDLWRSAERIPGVRVLLDDGGREAARFGSKTSGQVLLYSPSGELEFAGGITSARGHMGDNIGVDRLASLLTRGSADRHTSSVFGCAIFSEEER